MAIKDRMFLESPVEQGEDERIARTFDTIPWGGADSDPVCVIKLQGTSTPALLEGAASLDGNDFTTPIVKDLEMGNRYKVECSWILDSNTVEAFGWLTCSVE